MSVDDGRAPKGPDCSASPEPVGLGPSGEHPSRGLAPVMKWQSSSDDRALLLLIDGVAAAEIHRWADTRGKTIWWTLFVRGKEQRDFIETVRAAAKLACERLSIAYLPPPRDLLLQEGESEAPMQAAATTPTSSLTCFERLADFAREVDTVSRSGADTISFLVELNRLAKTARRLVQEAETVLAAARASDRSGEADEPSHGSAEGESAVGCQAEAPNPHPPDGARGGDTLEKER